MKKLHISFLFVFALGLSSCNDGELSIPAPKKVNFTIAKKMADIVFVMDNSGSMYEEQARMARAFPSLIERMELNDLEYRIAITTTDVSTGVSPYIAKYNSAKQGDFIKFADGSYYLTPKSKNIQSLFERAIQRPESLDANNPGSDDERGIYAANMSIFKNRQTRFFRPGSHIAWVFVSDEDVRGQGLQGTFFGLKAPEAMDYPATLIENIQRNISNENTTSAHAIVIGDFQCLGEQKTQPGRLAQFGEFYFTMADPNNRIPLRSDLKSTGQTYAQLFGQTLLPGTYGSICDLDYTQSIGSIVNVINQVTSFKNQNKTVYELPCRNLTESVEFTHIPAGLSAELIDDGRALRLSRPLSNTEYLEASLQCEQI